MGRLVSRKPIEININSPLNGYLPIFDGDTKLWETISSSSLFDSGDLFSGSAQVLITGTTGYDNLTSSIDLLSSSFLELSASYQSNFESASFTGSYKGDGSGLYNIPFSGVTGLVAYSSSVSIQLDALEDESGSIRSNFNSFTSSYSTGSFTGSFTGNGAGLYNISISGVTGLNTARIADGNATASISNTEGLRINTNTEITGSLIVSSGSATFDATLALTENSSLILNSGSNLYVYDGGIISGTFKGNGALLTDLTYATTGSNTFYGTQIFTGSVYITEDLIVLGSSSLQNITASSVDIGTNTINLNTFLPSVRYGGINVFDSGSSGVSASLLWDSQTDNWIFVHEPVGGPTDSSYFMYGPLSQDGVGSENILDGNYLTKVENNGHGHHLTTSSLFDNGLKVSINSNTEITGSFLTTGTIVSQTTPLVSGSSQVIYSGLTGIPSDIVSGSSQINNLGFAITGSNIFVGNQTVIGSVLITGSLNLSDTLIVSSSQMTNKNVIGLSLGNQTISTILTGSYTSAFYYYTVLSGSNARAGQIMVVWNGSSITYTDNSTTDIGLTKNVELTASLSTGNVVLSTVLPTDGWSIKTLVNLL
jgi:hypothetical protein